MIDQTILDLGVYKDTNDGSYDIAKDFIQNYTSHWDDDTLSISNDNNACYSSFTNNQHICANLETPGVQTCAQGYRLEGYF